METHGSGANKYKWYHECIILVGCLFVEQMKPDGKYKNLSRFDRLYLNTIIDLLPIICDHLIHPSSKLSILRPFCSSLHICLGCVFIKSKLRYISSGFPLIKIQLLSTTCNYTALNVTWLLSITIPYTQHDGLHDFLTKQARLCKANTSPSTHLTKLCHAPWSYENRNMNVKFHCHNFKYIIYMN